MASKITVLKFGSSTLRTESDLPRAVHEIYRHWRRGSQVLVVVSAIGSSTDDLLERAELLTSEPHPRFLAGLLATGEATSASLLGVALHRAGLPVCVLSPAQIGLRTAGETLDAEPVAVNDEKLREQLRSSIVVVSGFVGVDETDHPTLLGRGGSDLTALFLAHKLEADAILIKDVDGLYETDPNGLEFPARRFSSANWRTAIRVGDRVVQDKAIRFAKEQEVSFSITAAGSKFATLIDGGPDKFAAETTDPRPLSVVLLGCGTVGGGVFQALSSLPHAFEIVGVADRNRSKAEALGVPESLFTTDPIVAIERDCDVVIELFGGVRPTGGLIEHALKLGRNVVTANKALLADAIDRLELLAKQNNVTIGFSAAVGGVLPALETVSRIDGLRSFSGIVNGTCNFICDELSKGVEFADAVRAAQVAGFAEADPTLDISGTDAAQKLSLLVRAAFGVEPSMDPVEGITDLDPDRVNEARSRGNVFRLVAECRKTKDGITGSVRPVEIPESHPLALVKGSENRLLIETDGGSNETISGRGAGRWPTTEAVVADLFDLYLDSQHKLRTYAAAATGCTSTEVYA
jgi:homoserine dehydrogenase